MFKKESFETIMNRMLSRIPNTFDKREGSIIWDALAPAALEIESLYYAFEGVMQEVYASTASREFLKLRALERGLKSFEATKSIIKAKFNVSVNKGIRFKINSVIFKVLEVIDVNENTYKLECESLGVVGNISTGDLIQVDFVNGLNTAKIEGVLVLGKEEEDTESFRQRYFNSFEEQAFGGNVEEYKEKTLAIKGVGAVKVTPVHNGGGTVKLTILDSSYNKATNELIEQVQNVIDPQKQGKGLGLAPIGHVVTVDTPNELEINVQVKIQFIDTTNFNNKKNEIKSIIETYFNELKKDWVKGAITIRVVHIISKLLNISGVEDIIEIKINGNSNNLKLSESQIPKFVDVVEL